MPSRVLVVVQSSAEQCVHPTTIKGKILILGEAEQIFDIRVMTIVGLRAKGRTYTKDF